MKLDLVNVKQRPEAKTRGGILGLTTCLVHNMRYIVQYAKRSRFEETLFYIYKMAVAYSDRRKQFLLEEMAEMCPKLK